jgi:hypothetical protein
MATININNQCSVNIFANIFHLLLKNFKLIFRNKTNFFLCSVFSQQSRFIILLWAVCGNSVHQRSTALIEGLFLQKNAH